MLSWDVRTAGETALNQKVFQSCFLLFLFYHRAFILDCFFTGSSLESKQNMVLSCYFLKSSIYTKRISSKIPLYKQTSYARLRTYSAKLPQYMIHHRISLAHFEKKQEKKKSILLLKRSAKKTWYQKRVHYAQKAAGTHLST